MKQLTTGSKMEGYHYTECGLDNVYLMNGFEHVATPRGEGVTIKDIEGLHRAIGMFLLHEVQDLDGSQFRFLRHEMNLTQKNLAAILRVDVQSLARWEKGKTKGPIDGPAQGLLRVLYGQFLGGDPDVTGPLKKLACMDEKMPEEGARISMEDTSEGWQPSLAA